MEGHLITVAGDELEPTTDNIERLKRASTRFWLDLHGLDQATAEAVLQGSFGFHPLAVEDAEHFGQRPKLDLYDEFALLVVYGATASGQLVEVHCFYADQFLVTVHHDACPSLRELADRWKRRPAAHPDHVMLLYRVVDTLVDGYFPVLSNIDDQIDELEDEILARPTNEQLGRLFDLKRSLISMRKVVTPQRDMFATMLSGANALPGMTADAERYFRDLYDHLIRISDLVDSYRDLMSGALDTHLSTVSNRLNVVMKQLAIIATVFLPMSFLTGFFGQNFGWMVNHLTSFGVFAGAGLALQVAVAAVLLGLFWRRGWLGSEGVAGPSPSGRQPVKASRRWHVLQPGHRADPEAM